MNVETAEHCDSSVPLHGDSSVPLHGDSSVPLHCGDPLREQRVLHSAAGVLDLSDREVLTVTGPDRLPWLHTICSQHLEALADGDCTEALVLSPHGHVEQHWQVAELDGTVWLDTEPGAAATVLAYLQKMRFLKRVEPVDVSASWTVLSVLGPKTPGVLSAAALPVPPAGHAVALPAPGGFVRGRRWPAPSVDLVVPRGDKQEWLARLREHGARDVGQWAYDALRVQDRVPRLGFETDHRTIPHEVGWIGTAVHLQKGCYRGQETVARVQNLGRPPRRLVLLHLSGDSEQLPPPGTPVESGARTIGFLGTAVHHYELGPVALAVIKRSIADDAELQVAGFPVSIG
jgi:folate-binding protein YgfZ